MVYCPKCWMKNGRKAEACIDCGHVFTSEIKRVHSLLERRELMRWLFVFLAGVALFSLGFVLMAYNKPAAAHKYWFIWVIPCISLVCILWPKALSCLFFPGSLSERGAESIAYRSGSRINLAVSIRHAGLYLLLVNIVVVYIRAFL